MKTSKILKISLPLTPYMLKINSLDMKQYQQFLINVLGRIESVASIESTFVMEEVKHNYSVSVIKEETAVP